MQDREQLIEERDDSLLCFLLTIQVETRIYCVFRIKKFCKVF